jgi:Ca2+-binding RTX toxin-like protein
MATTPYTPTRSNSSSAPQSVNFDDVIVMAEAGTVSAGFGDDTVYGSSGGDQIFGDAGADQIFAGAGSDLVEGGSGADHLDGGTGNDTVSYAGSFAGVSVSLATGAASGGHAEGDSFAFATPPRSNTSYNSFENLVGSAHDDWLEGDSRANILVAGAGNDDVLGQGGDDVILGEAGDDLLIGGSGEDAIFGGAGDDRIQGGGQGDLVHGGAGADKFVLDPGLTIVKDFAPGEDKLVIGALLPNNINGNDAEVSSAFSAGYVRYVSDGNGNVLIQIDDDGAAGAAGWQTVAVLEGMTSAQISNSDFWT